MSLVIARPDLSLEVYPGAPCIDAAWEAWKVIESRREAAVLYTVDGPDIHPIARSHMTPRGRRDAGDRGGAVKPDLAKTCCVRTCRCGSKFATHDVERRKCDGCYLTSAMYGTDGTADVDPQACGIEGGQGRSDESIDSTARVACWVACALFAVGIVGLGYMLLDASLKGMGR